MPWATVGWRLLAQYSAERPWRWLSHPPRDLHTQFPALTTTTPRRFGHAAQGRRGCVPRQSRRLRRGDEWTAAVDETSLAAVVGEAAREPKHRRQGRQRSRTGHVVAILARAPWSARGPGPAQHGGSMPLEEGFQVAEADERCCYLAGRGTWSGIGSGGEAKKRKICPASPPAGSGWPATQQRAISVRLPRGWRSHGVDSVESGPATLSQCLSCGIRASHSLPALIMRVSVDVPRQGEQTCDASAAPELCLARRPQDLAELQAVAGRLPCLVGVCQARGRNLLAAAESRRTR